MDRSIIETRLAQNEVIYRRANEHIAEGVAQLKAIAKEANQQDVIDGIDTLVLHFRCECANAGCQRRIPMSIREYEMRHKNKQRFVVIAGHQDIRIEKVVLRLREYVVVEKYAPLPGDLTGLTP